MHVPCEELFQRKAITVWRSICRLKNLFLKLNKKSWKHGLDVSHERDRSTYIYIYSSNEARREDNKNITTAVLSIGTRKVNCVISFAWNADSTIYARFIHFFPNLYGLILWSLLAYYFSPARNSQTSETVETTDIYEAIIWSFISYIHDNFVEFHI